MLKFINGQKSWNLMHGQQKQTLDYEKNDKIIHLKDDTLKEDLLEVQIKMLLLLVLCVVEVSI